MRRILAVTLLVGAGACHGGRREPGITPIDTPFTFGVIRMEGRTLRAPVGSEVEWGPDGSATIVIDHTSALRVTGVAAGGLNVNDRDVARLLAESLAPPRSQVMKETRGDVTIWCQIGAPKEKLGTVALWVAVCLRVNPETRRRAVLTMGVFGAPAEIFDSLGGARLCAEVVGSARGFLPE